MGDIKRIVLFASGNGTNAERICTFFEKDARVEVAAILTNKRAAKVWDRANRLKVPAFCFNRNAFSEGDAVIRLLQALQPDLIVLAGFLWKVPEQLVKVFPNTIINIHPALLPKYGGKGMYGQHVHTAVKENNEKETGITIHYVNEHYDEGAIIFQAATNIEESDSVADIANKVHELEYAHYPEVIEKMLFKEND